MNIKLSEILSQIDIKAELLADFSISGVYSDSRKCVDNCIYTALPGTICDGHDFIDAAVQNGAKAVVISSERNYDSEAVTIIRTDDTRKIFAQLCRAFNGNPDEKMKMIGITGTNGKTTESYMVQRILMEYGYNVGVVGTLGYKLNDEHTSLNHTTPFPDELFGILSEMARKGMDYVVMEVSSHALEQKRVYGINFDYAVFTNLSQDHLDYHKDMDDYFEAKKILFDSLKENATAIINADDEYGRKLLSSDLKANKVSYGVENEADYRVTDINVSSQGSFFKINHDNVVIDMKLKIHGVFNIYNSLAAYIVASSETTIENAVKVLAEFPPVRGRFEAAGGNQPFTVIVDYAHTPDALMRVNREGKRIAEGRLITVFGAGGDRDNKKRPIMAEMVAKYSDVIIVTSDNPRTEDPEKIIDDVVKGIPENVEFIRNSNREEAIIKALSIAGEGDVVIIAGKGHEDYQIIGTTKHHFDDLEKVNIWLKENNYL